MADPARPPDLAVVVVNLDTGPYLTRCVRSAFENAGDATLEVVVVDNDSHDGSADAAVAANPGTVLIQNGSNRGFAAAANQGMRASTAPFILLLNPDAEILAGTLGGFVKVLRDRPRTGIVGAVVRDPDGAIYPSARMVPSLGVALGHAFVHPFWPENRFSRAYKLADWDRGSEREVEWVSGSCCLLRRAALDEVGMLDEGYFLYVEDVDLCTRLRAAGWEVRFSPELQVVHIGGISTRGKKWLTVQHSKSAYRYFVQHRSPGWRAGLRPFVWTALRARAELVARRQGDR
jgi:N-acetylglucosaminyl-diphospho-decaprenol L-rhamnosyltransferase